MKIMRNIIEIDEELCNGCGVCVPSCAEGALEIVNGKARIIGEKYCDGLGACLGECPEGALTIHEREVEDYDHQAVEELLAKQKAAREKEENKAGCACSGPPVAAPVFTPCQQANKPVSGLAPIAGGSSLTHWPLQIRLVPPSAPFLKGADLLVAADCTAFAYPHFHGELLKDKVVLVGCPKFDDVEMYVQKFSDIFAAAELRSVTIAIMEVPCCSGMRMIIQEAIRRSGVEVAVNEVVISTRGKIL